MTINNFKKYRNLYNTLLRLSKEKYFESNLRLSRNNPKKTWDLLKEATNLFTHNSKIEKIKINNDTTTDKKLIAEEFNIFFSNIGLTISNSINPSTTHPESLIPEATPTPNLILNHITPTHVVDVIKSFESKNGMDIHGVSTNLLKTLHTKSPSLLHTSLTLALALAFFPTSSRLVVLYLYLKVVIPSCVTTTAPSHSCLHCLKY